MLFADADDFFSNNAFDYFDFYLNSKSDLIYFMMESCFSDTLEKANRHLTYSTIINEYLNDINGNEDKLRYKMPGPVAKMIKREMIIKNQLTFDEVIASNDLMFSAKVGYYADKVRAVNHTVYIATVRHGSLTKTRTREIQYCRYLVQVQYNIFIKRIDKPHLQKHLTSKIIESLIYYGPMEFLKFLHVAIKNRMNIFLGFSHFKSSLRNWGQRKLKHDKYLKKHMR